MHAGGYEIVARTLGRGLGEHRGFDLEETLLVKVVASHLGDAVAQRHIALHGGAAQIEIAVLEPHLIADLLAVVDLERGGFRAGQDAELLRDDLDLAGRHLPVDCRFVARNQLAAHSYHKLGAAGKSDIEQAGVDRLVERTLHDTRTVAHEQKQHAAVVAHTVDPAVDRHFPPHVGQTQFTAHVRAFHP